MNLEEKRNTFLKLAKLYQVIKPKLSDFEKYSIECQLKIPKFEINYPNTKYYIDENMEPKKGILKSEYCKLCQENLDELRKYNPRRRFVDFCSSICRKEHNRRRKIYEKELGAENTTFLWWNHRVNEKEKNFHYKVKTCFILQKKAKQLKNIPIMQKKQVGKECLKQF